MKAKITGTITSWGLYRDPETGYFHAELALNPIPEWCGRINIITLQGYGPEIFPGQPVEAVGDYTIEKDEYYGSDIPTISFRLQHLRLYTGSKAATYLFLTSGNFKGIGPKMAEKILDYTGADIFGFCDAENAASELAAIKGLKKEKAERLVEKIRKLKSSQALMEIVGEIGGTYRQALELEKMYGKTAVDVVRRNPYVLCVAGLPFEVAERKAKEQGITQFDHIRETAIVDAIFREVKRRGDTTIGLQDLRARYAEYEATAGYKADMDRIFHSILRQNPRIENADGISWIQTEEAYTLEEMIAEQIRRIQTCARKAHVEMSAIAAIERTLCIEYSDEQRSAFSMIDRGGIGIVTGGPGTGKSTVMRGIISAYKKAFPDATVMLAAPTAAAAKRLHETTGLSAETIHRLLQIRPNGHEFESLDEYDPLPQGLVIIDEVSMLDEELFLLLLKAIPSGGQLLLVGDEDQLPSVGAGYVLHDLIQARIPAVRLRKVFRQGEGSFIAENARRIREGDTRILWDKDGQSFLGYCRTPAQVTQSVEAFAQKYTVKGETCRVFSSVRKSQYINGTVNLNRALQQTFQKGKPDTEVKGTRYRIGDSVIFTRNNYSEGYMNGDTGKVVAIYKDGRKHIVEVFKDDDGETILVRGKMLEDLELGYAITVHKAQGSECDTAIVVLPDISWMTTRQLLYVAVTRARKRVIILVENPSSLKDAIRNASAVQRRTLLTRQIINAMRKSQTQMKVGDICYHQV